LTRNQPNVLVSPSRPSYRSPLVVRYRPSSTGFQQHQQHIKAMSTAKRSSTSKTASKKSAAAKAPSHPTWVDMIKVCFLSFGTPTFSLLALYTVLLSCTAVLSIGRSKTGQRGTCVRAHLVTCSLAIHARFFSLVLLTLEHHVLNVFSCI
jgi:hypothetical protein